MDSNNHGLNGYLAELQNRIQQLQYEAAESKRLQAEKTRLLTNALAERDRASQGWDRAVDQLRESVDKERGLLLQIQKLQMLLSKAKAQLEESQDSEAMLREKVQHLEDQVNNKKALWAEYHPKGPAKNTTPSNRIQSPSVVGTPIASRQGTGVQLQGSPPAFNLPLAQNPDNYNNSHGDNTSRSQNQTSGLTVPTITYSPAQPPRFSREWTPGANPFNSGVNIGYSGSFRPPQISTHSGLTNFGSSVALVPFKSPEAHCADFEGKFTSLFRSLSGWASKYANTPPGDIAVDMKMEESPIFWNHALFCVAPKKGTNATNHLALILRSAEFRHLAVMRFIMEYILQTMWKPEAWEAWGGETGQMLADIRQRMAQKIDSDELGALTTSRSDAILNILEHNDYVAFKNSQISAHGKAMRDRVGPVLNVGAVRPEAGIALGVIVGKAWDLAGEMHTTGCTFVMSMLEVGDRYNPMTMEAFNGPNDLNHRRQYTIRLGVTPGVTMRDDRRRSIRTKAICTPKVILEINN